MNPEDYTQGWDEPEPYRKIKFDQAWLLREYGDMMNEVEDNSPQPEPNVLDEPFELEGAL